MEIRVVIFLPFFFMERKRDGTKRHRQVVEVREGLRRTDGNEGWLEKHTS